MLELAQGWKVMEDGTRLEVVERRLTMGEVVKASEEGRVRKKAVAVAVAGGGGADLLLYTAVQAFPIM